MCGCVLSLRLDFGCPAASSFHYALHFAIVARRTSSAARPDFARSAARVEVGLEGRVARQARRIGLQVLVEIFD